MALALFNERLEALAKTESKDEARNWAKENTKLHRLRQLTDEEAKALMDQGLTHIKTYFPDPAQREITVTPGAGDAPGHVASRPSDKATPQAPAAGFELDMPEPVSAPGVAPDEIVLASTRNPLMPVTTGKALKAAWDAWQQTADSLIDKKNDISVIHGKEYLNITFWRKIAVAYGIEAWPRPGTRKILIDADGSLRAEVEMAVKAPNGRQVQSFGIASTKEAKLKAVSEHDLMARAWSRAYVRGMRDLVGFGAPSAEEVEE